MRRSVVLGLWQDRPPLEAIETAKIADELGYPELWIGEMATFDAFALATAIGLQTKQIELTIGPLAVHVRSPMTMAMGVASVAALTGRKVNLAIGTSSPVVVENWHGRKREAPARRLEEAAQELRTLLAGARGSGGYRLRLDPPGSSLTVAAFGDKAIDVAARYADRMAINMVTSKTAARLREKLDKVAAHAGRPTPKLAVWLAAAVDPDADAVAQITRTLVGYLPQPGYGEMFTEAGFGDVVSNARAGTHPRDLLAAPPIELATSVALIGSRQAIGARMDEYEDAGVDEIGFVPATAGDAAGTRTLAALV